MRTFELIAGWYIGSDKCSSRRLDTSPVSSTRLVVEIDEVTSRPMRTQLDARRLARSRPVPPKRCAVRLGAVTSDKAGAKNPGGGGGAGRQAQK